MISKPISTALAIYLLILPWRSTAESNLKKSDFETADKIEVHYFKGKHPLIYKTSDKNHLIFFKQAIEKAKNNPKLKCDTTGMIIYFNENRQLLKVYFSTNATGSKLTSPAITYHANNHNITSLITYNIGMILDEAYYQISKTR